MAALPSRGAVIIMPDTRVATSRKEGSTRLSSISDVGYTVKDHSVTLARIAHVVLATKTQRHQELEMENGK